LRPVVTPLRRAASLHGERTATFSVVVRRYFSSFVLGPAKLLLSCYNHSAHVGHVVSVRKKIAFLCL